MSHVPRSYPPGGAPPGKREIMPATPHDKWPEEEWHISEAQRMRYSERDELADSIRHEADSGERSTRTPVMSDQDCVFFAQCLNQRQCILTERIRIEDFFARDLGRRIPASER